MSKGLRASHFDETEDRLLSDPVINHMAAQIHADPNKAKILASIAHADGTPRFEFIQRANAAYRDLGGTDGGHIGAVPNTILRIFKILGDIK